MRTSASYGGYILKYETNEEAEKAEICDSQSREKTENL
jgi:hypothetical protein